MARISAPSILSISLRLIGISPCLSGQLMQEAPEMDSDPAGPGSGSEGQRKAATVGVRAPLIQASGTGQRGSEVPAVTPQPVVG